MGKNDGVARLAAEGNEQTFLTPTLRTNLLKLSINKAFAFYQDFFGTSDTVPNLDSLADEYEKQRRNAQSLGLFKKGGIREKDHLNLWCLGRVLLPTLYVESGVFIGSSLHAFLRTPTLPNIVAIDPDLTKLKIPSEDLPAETKLIDNQDFSQVSLPPLPEASLVYFDDHINSASRIIQSHEKGLRYLLFDDSTGWEGVCQRLYPAVPTVPMIMNWEALSVNDKVSWTWEKPTDLNTGLIETIKTRIWPSKSKWTRVTLTIDETFVEECKRANRLVKKFTKIVDLGEYIPQTLPEKMVDTTKYLVELHR